MVRLRPAGPRYTAFDYTLIALNPALVVLMVSAVLCFLVEVFYPPDMQGRMSFIAFCFSLGTVCVTRISIELGSKHALGYGLALAVVTLLAANKFIEFSGFWASFGFLLNVLLIAAAWYASYKLTWDSTVLEEERLGDGRGLLETAGLESGRGDAQQPAPDAIAQDKKSQEFAQPEPQPEWDLLGGAGDSSPARQRKTHPHGVWVVYCTLAALPIFGLGQGVLQDDASRRSALWLFCQFLASAMALLATTSLIGIRRYLRRRNLTMPADMTVTWLATGAVIVLGVMLAALALPRPGAEVSFLPHSLAAKNLRPNRWGTFQPVQTSDASSGKQSTGQGDATGKSERGKLPAQSGRAEKSAVAKASEGATSREGSSGRMDSGGPDSSQSSGQSRDAQRSRPARPDSAPSSSKSADAKERSGTSSQPSDKAGSSQGTDEKQRSGSFDSKRSAESRRSPDVSDTSGVPRSEIAPPYASHPPQLADSRQASGAGGRREDAGTRSQSDVPSESASDAASQDTHSSSARAWRWPSPDRVWNALPNLGNVLRWLYWLGVIAVAAFLLWKYWSHVQEYIRHVMDQLRQLWQWWFAAKQQPDAQPETSSRPLQRVTFRGLRDPFLTGDAERMSIAELTRYCFSALEVWAQDMGVPRRADITPLEFAQSVGASVPELSEPALRLAHWYCRVAYGDRRVPEQARQSLTALWATLVRLYREPQGDLVRGSPV